MPAADSEIPKSARLRQLRRALIEAPYRRADPLPAPELPRRTQGFWRLRPPRPPRRPGLLERARALAFALNNAPLRVSEGELLVGDLGLSPAARERTLPAELARLQGQALLLDAVDRMAPDHETVLRRGFGGLLDEIVERERRVERSLASSPDRDRRPTLEEQRIFYEAARVVVEAAAVQGQRWSRRLRQLAQSEPDGGRRRELEVLAEISAKVPARPAEGLHEALQSLVTTHTMLRLESSTASFSFGRMDRYLAPHLEADLSSGALTRSEAIELLGCFLIKAAETPSSTAITLGPEDGDRAAGEVATLLLEAQRQVRQRNPAIHIRFDERPSSSGSFTQCARLLAESRAALTFSSDRAALAALTAAGVSEEDARDYSLLGGGRRTIAGRSTPTAPTVFLNLAALLHLALHDGQLQGQRLGPATGQADALSSMDAIIEALRRQLDALLDQALVGDGALAASQRQHRPLLSTLTADCLPRGLEVGSRGARYAETRCLGVGLADLVDGLVAIDELVFEQRRLGLGALVRAVDRDFSGQEPLRARIINRLPAYGQGDARVDALGRRISAMFAAAVSARRAPGGVRWRPGLWSGASHWRLGQRTPALPNGRAAGEPLASGVSPSPLRPPPAATAAATSAARVVDRRLADGAALELKLDRTAATGALEARRLQGLIEGFFQLGGSQLQLSGTDVTTSTEPAPLRQNTAAILTHRAPTAEVFAVQRASTLDGPGLRTVVLFKGCDLRCAWCRHPESLRSPPELSLEVERCLGCGDCQRACQTGAIDLDSPERLLRKRCQSCGRCALVCPSGAMQLIGREMTVDELVDRCLEDQVFHHTSDGGVTLSGGEPMLQAEFLGELLPALRAEGLSVALETAANYPFSRLEPLLEQLDHILIDYKLPGDEAYRRDVGAGHGRVLENLAALQAREAPLTLRSLAIPALNTHPNQIGLVAAILIGLGITELELLRYDNRWERKLARLETSQRPLSLSADALDLERLAAFFAFHGITARLPGDG